MNLKTLLITGTGGFVASRMALDLAGIYNVHTADHRDLDITEADACMRLFDTVQPDLVAHFAAISRIDVCEKNPELAHRVNVIGTENIARACAAHGSVLVSASSDQVYTGLSSTFPHVEDEALCPANVYARTKLEAEQRAAALLRNFYALRLTWMFDLPVRHCADSLGIIGMCMHALLTGTPVRVLEDDHRGFTYVREVIENIPRLVEAAPGIYNYGSVNFASTYETCCHIFRRFGAENRIDALLQSVKSDSLKNLMIDDRKQKDAGILFSTSFGGIDRLFDEYYPGARL